MWAHHGPARERLVSSALQQALTLTGGTYSIQEICMGHLRCIISGPQDSLDDTSTCKRCSGFSARRRYQASRDHVNYSRQSCIIQGNYVRDSVYELDDQEYSDEGSSIAWVLSRRRERELVPPVPLQRKLRATTRHELLAICSAR